jgi:hypothetical protein
MSYGMTPTSTGMNPTTTNTAKEKIPSGYKKGSLQQFTPEQMNLFQQMFGQVGPDSYLSKLAGGDQNAFDEMEAPALRQFGELQGNIASRFSGGGNGGQGRGLGSRNSNGFQNTMNSAASNFAQQLQSQRQSIQQQAIQDLHGMSSSLLGQRPQENFLVEKQQKPNYAGLAGGIAGGLAGSFLGPLGTAAGQSAGNWASNKLFG